MDSGALEHASRTFPGIGVAGCPEGEDNTSRLNRVYGFQAKDLGNPLIRSVMLACARSKGNRAY